jgi:hypothetical protein
MPRLVRLNNIENRRLLQSLADQEIAIYEDVQGHTIFMQWTGETFELRAKTHTAEPVNLVDLAMQRVYSKAIDYFNALPTEVKRLLNTSWHFCFEYFYDTQPAHIKYDRLPKNGLILTSIVKGKKNFSNNLDEISEYAELFNCEYTPIIYRGRLNQKQLDLINSFLNTSKNDLEYVFGDSNFADFFYKILSPNIDGSYLMQKGKFQDNLEKIVIRCLNSNEEMSFEILNPLYQRMSDNNTTEFVEMYSLILLDFLEHCQTINLKDVKLDGSSREEVYIDIICKMFNPYAEKLKQKNLDDLQIVVPEFFQNDKFKINTDLLKNKVTKSLVQHSKLEYVFKVILGSLNYKRKKSIGVFNENTLAYFNDFVDSLHRRIDKHINIERENTLQKKGLLNFNDFYEITYDTDATGKVYPDLYQKAEEISDLSKKKKGLPPLPIKTTTKK